MYAESSGVIWCNSPVAAKAATGMVEKAVDIFQRFIKKMTPDPSKWTENVQRAVFEVNNREVLHLLHSPAQIMFGFDPRGATTKHYPD
ncbi:hypothetical protein GcC1_159012 [Golovinomyces cichoracearum]|uniref:Uncharacterized protein n=1 Tax=Golovinomyces cichoracearum TaxID=62708 RepID=A0A420HUK0_9PEZI|nr:hypothetical protein GcC1_159012 [Golovinomyces cichoracearum]